MTDFDWTDNADVAALIGTQLTVGIAALVAQGHDETDLIGGYLSGRHKFLVSKDEVILYTQEGETIK